MTDILDLTRDLVAIRIPAANFGPGEATLAHTADEQVARAPIERRFAAPDDLLRTGP